MIDILRFWNRSELQSGFADGLLDDDNATFLADDDMTVIEGN